MNTANLKKEYQERIIPALTKEFGYTSVMQVPKLEKIVINQGLGKAVADRKIIETAIAELTAITGQKAVVTTSKKTSQTLSFVRKCPSERWLLCVAIRCTNFGTPCSRSFAPYQRLQGDRKQIGRTW